MAAVPGWDGTHFVGVPGDRLPLILLNAVVGPCTVSTGRPPVPADAVMLLTQVMQRFLRRP